MATETHATTDAGHVAGTEAAGHAAGGGGLPQFDLQWWPGQIAWAIIVFLVLLAFMRYFATPKLGGTIAAREAKIEGDVAEARRLKEEADAQVAEAAAERDRARAQSVKLAGDARAAARAELDQQLAQEEARLAETSATAEAGIAKARGAAMANVAAIAGDAAQAIVAKLTGVPASAAELSRAESARG